MNLGGWIWGGFYMSNFPFFPFNQCKIQTNMRCERERERGGVDGGGHLPKMKQKKEKHWKKGKTFFSAVVPFFG